MSVHLAWLYFNRVSLALPTSGDWSTWPWKSALRAGEIRLPANTRDALQAAGEIVVPPYFSSSSHQHVTSNSAARNLKCEHTEEWPVQRHTICTRHPGLPLWWNPYPPNPTWGPFLLGRNFFFFFSSGLSSWFCQHGELYLHKSTFTSGRVLSGKADPKVPKLIHQ